MPKTLALIHQVYADKRYLDNGAIEKTYDGKTWKKYRQVKPGVDVAGHTAKALRLFDERLTKQPFYREFRALMISLTDNLEDRTKIILAIDLMPDDLDGVYSTLQDEGIDLSFEDIQQVAEAYDLYKDEKAATKKQVI